VQDTFPLTQIQQYLLKHYGSPHNEPWCYHTQFSYRLHIRNLNLPLFFKAVQQVLNRHPVLRTVICMENGHPAAQRIAPSLSLKINYSDFSMLNQEEQAMAIEELLLTDRNNPFDFLRETLPLFRAGIVTLAPEDLHFILSCHHAIWDGWSLAVFMREVCSFYQELKTNPTASLATAEYDYPDFIAYESTIQCSTLAGAFWKDRMKDFRPHSRVLFESDEAYSSYQPAERIVSKVLIEKMLALQKEQRATLKAMFLWGFYRVLQLTDPDHTTIGVITNGRSMSLPNPLTTLGLLWNIAPLCIPAQTDKLIQLKQVNEVLSKVSAHGSYPLTAILNDSNAEDRLPAVFNFINFEGANLLRTDSDITFTTVGGLDKFHFPLHLLVGKNPFNKDFRLILNYDTRLYRKTEIESLLDVYLKELTLLCENVNGLANTN
jgi:hypothetical protein